MATTIRQKTKAHKMRHLIGGVVTDTYGRSYKLLGFTENGSFAFVKPLNSDKPKQTYPLSELNPKK